MIKPPWALRQAPEHVRLRWPSVTRWAWLSPLRLMGEDWMNGGKTVHLVVVDPHTDQHAMGQAVPDYRVNDPAYVSEVFGRLRLMLGEEIAARLACEDGTPVRAEHSSPVCRWCGKRCDEHSGLGLEREP